MHWLEGGYHNLQLDIIGFLAILGEASIKTNAQVHQLSVFSLLPQLIPAPQALIRTSRPTTLKVAPGKVLGCQSGSIRDYVQHLANLLHDREPLEKYQVRCERITKPNPNGKVSAKKLGPLVVTSSIGFAMSVALVTIAAIRQDGFGLLATILLSFLSTLIGIGSRWNLVLSEMTSNRDLPEDRIVVAYPNGSFQIVMCKEEVARELYWHPETCNYVFSEAIYRFISLIGTLTLMVGVVCLGNASLDLQVAFGASYLVLNAAYWIVAALPPQWHWDLSCYHVERINYQGVGKNPRFTLALWQAIAITGRVDWVNNGRIAPVAEHWKKWMDEAEQAVFGEQDRIKKENREGSHHVSDEKDLTSTAVRPLPQWDAEGVLTALLKEQEKDNRAQNGDV